MSVSWADVRPIGSRSLSLEMMEWKRQYESNSRGVRNRSAVKAWAQHFDRKRRDLQAKLTFYAQYREGRLIHKNPRTKLWTSGNFLSGSSALPIGYFLFNFLQTFRRSLAGTRPAPRRAFRNSNSFPIRSGLLSRASRRLDSRGRVFRAGGGVGESSVRPLISVVIRHDDPTGVVVQP